jgi:hypothetical protein
MSTGSVMSKGKDNLTPEEPTLTGTARFLLPLGQGGSSLSIGNGLLFLLVAFGPQLKPSVPDKTGAAESFSKLLACGLVGKNLYL